VNKGRLSLKDCAELKKSALSVVVCFVIMYNNYSMSPSWIWSDKITNERVARVGYNHFISNKGEWNDRFSKFSNRVLPPIFISTILQSGKLLNLAHYFPYDAKLRLLAHSRSFLANQKARNAIVGAENLPKTNRFHVAVRLFSFRSQKTSKCSRNISDTLGATCSVPIVCSIHILTSSVIYHWIDARQHGIYLLQR